MKTMRKGSRQKVLANLKRHADLMAQYQAAGMSRDDASKKAAETMKQTRD